MLSQTSPILQKAEETLLCDSENDLNLSFFYRTPGCCLFVSQVFFFPPSFSHQVGFIIHGSVPSILFFDLISQQQCQRV